MRSMNSKLTVVDESLSLSPSIHLSLSLAVCVSCYSGQRVFLSAGTKDERFCEMRNAAAAQHLPPQRLPLTALLLSQPPCLIPSLFLSLFQLLLVVFAYPSSSSSSSSSLIPGLFHCFISLIEKGSANVVQLCVLCAHMLILLPLCRKKSAKNLNN